MTDSSTPDLPDAEHERGRQRRIEAVKRWAEYIDSEPVETWGPQQNTVVNDQLDAARNVGTTAEHRQRIETVAGEILEARDRSEDGRE